MGHMYNLLKEEDKNNASVKQDLENILKAIPSFLDIMLSQTMMLAQAFK
jgi:hypothetical protein